MKKLCLVAILGVFTFTTAFSQIKYCLSYVDFKANRWIPLDTIHLTEYIPKKKYDTKPYNITLTTGDKTVDKILKKDAFVVMYNDTILINRRNMVLDGRVLGNGYTRALHFGEKGLCFLSAKVGVPISVGLLIFPHIGGAWAMASYDSGNMRCYFVERELPNGKIEIITIDDTFMERFEAKNPDVYQAYKEMKRLERTNGHRILQLLWDWKIVW